MPGYILKNMVGHISTRMHRWKSPTRHRSNQMLGELRVVPTRPLTISEEVFKQHEKAILQKVLSGELMVTCPDGTTITSTPLGQLIYRSANGVVNQPGVSVTEEPKPTKAQEMNESDWQAKHTEAAEVEAAPLPEPTPAPAPEPPPTKRWEEPKAKAGEHAEKKRRR